MNSLYTQKADEVTSTPLLLFECELRSGAMECWSTHAVTIDGREYRPVVLRHDIFELHSATDTAIDGADKVKLTLANADSGFSQIERSLGWKGARLTVSSLFFDFHNGTPASDSRVVFKGIANAPEEIAEDTIRLSFANRFNVQRLQLPQVRIQRQCPWMFPDTPEKRSESVDGNGKGKYSPVYACGYSPDQVNGCGNLDGAEAYVSCNYSREDCTQRGMFDKDAQGRITRRFGGIEFVPSTILVRGHGEARFHSSAVFENEAKYNDFVPLVYGTAWYQPPVILSRSDGNLTHIEVLIAAGEVATVHRVLVNGVEIPKAETGRDMSATGWFALVSGGSRNGSFNATFRDAAGNPSGDPYGGLSVLAIVVPNGVNDGRAKPQIQVLINGIKLPTYSADGEFDAERFTNNPAWVLLDLLRRTGWELDEIAIPTFAKCAAYCDELVSAEDLQGRETSIPRFQCNLLLRNRRSATDIIRGVRNGSGLFLRYSDTGEIELAVESTVAIQQPTKPEYSNSTESLNNGWPAYEFGDGTYGFSGILRRPDGQPAIRLWSRGTADSANRLTLEFQDEFNEFQQDSLSMVDYDDVVSAGHEIAANLPALGVPNFNQAARVIRMQLDRTVRGNSYVEFQTGLLGLGVRPGDLITITYLKEGLNRQLFRVLRVAPGMNYRTATITAQIHDDRWYEAALGRTSGGANREPGAGTGIPRPIAGSVVDNDGETQYGIEEEVVQNSDSTYAARLRVHSTMPGKLQLGLAPPLVGITPYIDGSNGTLKRGAIYYYGVTAQTAELGEGPLSFVVRCEIPAGDGGVSVQLRDLRFPAGAASFNVYRGLDPNRMCRIASGVPIGNEFTDEGLSASLGTAPDPNFDHANFYWRFEYVPECAVEAATENMVTLADIAMVAGEHCNRTLRIIAGKGKGQERTILSNDENTLTVVSAWAVVPDTSSRIAVAESAWRFAVAANSSPALLDVPNRKGTGIQVCGRASNSIDREALYELSPVTRWTIGGGSADVEVPGAPTFAMTATGRGAVEVTGIGFEHLENTKTVTSGTLTLHYLDETAMPSPCALADAITDADESITVSGPAGIDRNAVLQIDAELVTVLDVVVAGTSYIVQRGILGTETEPHDTGAPVSILSRKTEILPFPRQFFGTPASGSYSHSIEIRNARIAAAELFVSNIRGNSETHAACFTDLIEGGLRTLSGGQFNLQVDGPLAIQSDAVPRLVINENYSVRDISAIVTQAPTEEVAIQIRKNGNPYCDLIIPAGEDRSNVVDGYLVDALRSNDDLSLDIIRVSQSADSSPGRDLTVTIRV